VSKILLSIVIRLHTICTSSAFVVVALLLLLSAVLSSAMQFLSHFDS